MSCRALTWRHVLRKPRKGPVPCTCICDLTTSCGYVNVDATIFDAALATTCASSGRQALPKLL